MDMFKTKDFLEISISDFSAKVLLMPVEKVLEIQYVSVRGRDLEQGAVQRVLSTKRIDSIEKYVSQGHTFYSPFFLNWNNLDNPIQFDNDGCLCIPLVPSSAQVLDGQHRLEGLRKAMKKDELIGKRKILVILSENLQTKEAAEIFININTEQRPVPKSLIYDLFGVINDGASEDPVLDRARDLANKLQCDEMSPYYSLIKYPGLKRGVGKVDLSTVINALQPHLESNGVFNQKKLYSLETQSLILINYFSAIKEAYDECEIWDVKAQNPFLSNAGFYGAIEALCGDIINKCIEKKSFSIETFSSILNFEGNILRVGNISGIEGRTQRKTIKEFLLSHVNDELPEEDEYKF